MLRQLAPSLLKIGIDVRFHKSRDRDRKRLITITASRPDEIDAEAVSASAASEKPASGHEEGHNDVSSDDGTGAAQARRPASRPQASH